MLLFAFHFEQISVKTRDITLTFLKKILYYMKGTKNDIIRFSISVLIYRKIAGDNKHN